MTRVVLAVVIVVAYALVRHLRSMVLLQRSGSVE